MRLLCSFIMFIALLCPSYSFAETVAVQQVDQSNVERNSRRVKPSDNSDSPYKQNDDASTKQPANSRPNGSVSRPNVKSSNNHGSSNSTRYNNYYKHHYVNPSRTYSRVYYVHKRAHTPRYSTVIVYDKPNITEYSAYNKNAYVEAVTSNSVNYNKTFGIGFVGVVEVNSPIGNLDSHSSGGFGFYIKYRPTRYFSIEFTNSYLFGTLKYTDSYLLGYTKIPITLGVRTHFLDYGIVDTYAVLAASMSVITYPDEYNYRQDTYVSSNEYQYGGQFGIGVSYITGRFEIGFDVRYTIESIPEYIPYYISDDARIIHGGLLTLSVGLTL